MFINKEGKLFGKVSIIDIFVLIIIVVAAFGVYTRFFTTNERVEVNKKQLEYQIKIEKVRQGTFDALSKLGPVYDKTTKEYMGEIKAVASEPYYEGQELANGELKKSEIPDRMNVIITIEADGSESAVGFYVGGSKYIGAGSSFNLTTKYAETTGEIVSIKEIQ